MSWVSSVRSRRLPADWQERRQFVAQRAGFQCEATMRDGTRCCEYGSDCDHIERGDDHSVNNLQWLCRWHHKQKTQREAKEALMNIRKQRELPAKKHPGLLD